MSEAKLNQPRINRGSTVRVLPTSTSASLHAAANKRRLRITLKNVDAAITIFIGTTSGVTTANGFALKPNETYVDDYGTHDWWAIAASGTPLLHSIES